MERDYVFIALFLALVATIFYLAFLVFAPFFVAITWGIIISLTFFPLYRKLRRYIRIRMLSSLVMCILVFVIIIGPVIYFGITLVGEAVNAYSNVERYITSKEYNDLLSVSEHPYFNEVRKQVERYVDLREINITSQVLNFLNSTQSFILRQLRSTVRQFSGFLLDFIFVFFTMYYLFKDGEKLVDNFKGIIPLSEEQTQLIFGKLTEVVEATIYGGVSIALIQGLLGGLMFWILGIATPVFWGALMAFCSLLPLIGSWVVFMPAVIYFFVQGSILKGIILMVWGAGVVSSVDNFLRPYLVSDRTQMHPLILFFSIFGGIQVFGFLGIFLGPVLASLFVALIKILQSQIHEHREESQEIPIA